MKLIKPLYDRLIEIFDGMKYGKRVRSSHVRYVKFDKDTDVLYITFKGNRQYAYPDSSKEEFRELLQSPSKGKFVWNRLRRTNREYFRVR